MFRAKKDLLSNDHPFSFVNSFICRKSRKGDSERRSDGKLCGIESIRLVQVMSEEFKRVIGNFNLLKPTGHVMHQQFNIQQLYILPTLYLCVLYLSENKQRLVPVTA